MSYPVIPSLNDQIMTALDGIVADGTEKQNAADAIETLIVNGGFEKEILNDTLRDNIKNNHSSHAIVSVAADNEVTVSDVGLNEARTSLEAIRKEAKRVAIDAALQAADTGNILGIAHDDFVAQLNA